MHFRVCESIKVSTQDFISENMGSILDFWFADSVAIDKFPFSIIGGNSVADLLAQHGSALVYKLLLYKPDQLILVARQVNQTEEELLVNYTSSILAKLCPALIQTSSSISLTCNVERIEQRKLHRCVSAYNYFSNKVDISSAGINSTLLSKIILELLNLSHFPSGAFSEGVVSDPHEPFFSPSLVSHTLENFNEIFKVPVPLLVLAGRSGYPLHEVVLAIQNQFNSAKTIGEMRKALAMLSAFMYCLQQYLSNDLFQVSLCIW